MYETHGYLPLSVLESQQENRNRRPTKLRRRLYELSGQSDS